MPAPGEAGRRARAERRPEAAAAGLAAAAAAAVRRDRGSFRAASHLNTSLHLTASPPLPHPPPHSPPTPRFQEVKAYILERRDALTGGKQAATLGFAKPSIMDLDADDAAVGLGGGAAKKGKGFSS